MKFVVKYYPQALPGEVKVSEIRSKKRLVCFEEKIEEADARRRIIDGAHEGGMFIKKIIRQPV